jgi:predicted ribosomally synthesized peptide with SipW-like signal peptide
MSDKNIDLSRRKILAGLGAVGAAGAGAGLGTSAFFSDEESFDGNVITAGELDLAVGYYSYWDQGIAGSGSVSGSLDGESVSAELSDVKPGDSGLVTFCPVVENNDAYLWLCGAVTSNAENGQTEPEADVDETGGDPGEGNGELADNIAVTATYCEVGDLGEDGEFTPEDVTRIGDAVAFEGTLSEMLQSGIPLDGAAESVGEPGDQACFEGSEGEVVNPCVCIEWEVPTDVGNEIQTDSVEFDLSMYAQQCRHNDGTENPCADGDEPACECPDTTVDTGASQSPEVSVQSTDASSFPQVSTFLSIDTPAGTAGDLTASDFALAEGGCGQDIDVEFTSEDKPVDFVFLMDVTGSMGGELDSVKDNIQDFVNSVDSQGIDAQYALYLYGDDEDTGPPAVYLKQDFTSDATTFVNSVQDSSLREEVGYGGDTPEDNYEAILTADNDLSYRTGSQRLMIDITDAIGEEDPDQTIGGLAQTRDNAVSVINGNSYTYIAVSPDSDSEHQKKPLAQNEADNGLWIELGEDFDPILEEIEEEVTTSYRVRYETACPEADGSTRDIVIEIDDPDAGTLYATTSYTAPSA